MSHIKNVNLSEHKNEKKNCENWPQQPMDFL
jgi:hypothetical protein